MRFPDAEQVEIAILWLEHNEGKGAEGEACKAVAAWLGHQQEERIIRTSAREAGVSTATFRRKLKELEAARTMK